MKRPWTTLDQCVMRSMHAKRCTVPEIALLLDRARSASGFIPELRDGHSEQNSSRRLT